MINESTWMSDASRTALLEKADRMQFNLIGPDDYSMYVTTEPLTSAADGGTLFDNVRAINLSHRKFLSSVISSELNVWIKRRSVIGDSGVSPIWVNGNYEGSDNSFNIYAGMLGPEVFVPGEYEYNLGRIGWVIAHEIGHGFDSNNASLDAYGKMKQILTDEDLLHYEGLKEKMIALIDTYDCWYDPAEDSILYQDGTLTVAENLADSSGLQVVIRIAMRHGGPDCVRKVLENSAKAWTHVNTSLESILGDMHSVDRVRVNALIPMYDEFYEAFGVQEGDAMYVDPEARVKMWE